MRTLMGRLAVIATALVTIVAGATSTACAADDPYSVLVFSKTAGFRHDSIAVGTQAIRDLGAANNFSVTATEDAAAFTTGNLNQYDAVVFLNTTGDVLNAAQQTAFEGYIAAGNGYVGVHAAADTEYDWPFYGNLVGAYFLQHPAIQPARVVIEDRAHAATAHLGSSWTRTDEWYSFRTNPRATAHVLASLDESSYSGGGMGDHPITWCKGVGGGRSFYTGFGHTQESYADAAVRQVLLGGIRYASGQSNADCRPETGYTALYNGSTTGWSQAGPGSFTNTNGTLTSTGGMGMLWYSAKEFRSYSLKADWKMAGSGGDDNSGIFIGFPPSSDPWSAVNNGYEIQIDATDAADRTTGSVYGFKGADTAARDAALNPPGEWNTFELLVEGERVQIFLNGVKVNDFTNTDPLRSLTSGHIGLQNHGADDEVAFRNIRVKESGTNPVPGPGAVRGINGKCMDVSGANTADGTQIQLWTCNGSGAQIWSRTGQTVRALNKCLDVSGGGTANGTRVQLWTCNGTGAQNWVVESNGAVRNPQSNRCLESPGGQTGDGTALRIWDCNSGANQRWVFPT